MWVFSWYIYVFPQSDFSLFHVSQLLCVPHGQDVEHRVDQKHKTGQDCHRTHCTCFCHSLKCKMEWKNKYRNTRSFTFSEFTHRGRMLVRINLLWAHGNEEKEAKEVEQEQLESEQGSRKRTKIIGFSHRKWLVVPHDDANHEHDGDEEVASTCHHPKDKVVFWSLVIDIGWISINIRRSVR